MSQKIAETIRHVAKKRKEMSQNRNILQPGDMSQRTSMQSLPEVSEGTNAD
jgi:hypothetical protein